jgi:hypothetical protein
VYVSQGQLNKHPVPMREGSPASSGQVWENKLTAGQLKDNLFSLYLHLYQDRCIQLNITGFSMANGTYKTALDNTYCVGENLENKNFGFFHYYFSDVFVCVIYKSYLGCLNSCELLMFHIQHNWFKNRT